MNLIIKLLFLFQPGKEIFLMVLTYFSPFSMSICINFNVHLYLFQCPSVSVSKQESTMVASKNSIGACLVCYCICCPYYVHLYGHCACIRELPVPDNIGYVMYAYIYTCFFIHTFLTHLFVYKFFIPINFLSRQVIQYLIFRQLLFIGLYR